MDNLPDCPKCLNSGCVYCDGSEADYHTLCSPCSCVYGQSRSAEETEKEWETRIFFGGGGFEFADEVAEGIKKRVEETMKLTNNGSGGIMINNLEIYWLTEAYRRLREQTKVVKGG